MGLPGIRQCCIFGTNPRASYWRLHCRTGQFASLLAMDRMDHFDHIWTGPYMRRSVPAGDIPTNPAEVEGSTLKIHHGRAAL